MTTRNKLIILEAIASLFGWIWAGGFIATLVFAGLALFGGWSWWNVLYAVIASSVAKGLARLFLYNEKRVAFEAEMGVARHVVQGSCTGLDTGLFVWAGCLICG